LALLRVIKNDLSYNFYRGNEFPFFFFKVLNDSDEYHQPLLPYGMLIFGGFDGQLKSDVLVYIVGICTSLATKEQCLTAMPGVKCVWNKAAKKCEPLASISKEGYEKCPGLGNWT
jgi:hypothetical protein